MVVADSNPSDTTESVMRTAVGMSFMIMDLRSASTSFVITLSFCHLHIQETGLFALSARISTMTRMGW